MQEMGPATDLCLHTGAHPALNLACFSVLLSMCKQRLQESGRPRASEWECEMGQMRKEFLGGRSGSSGA